MEIYGKSLVYTVFLILILIVVQHLLDKYTTHKSVESFDNPLGSTHIVSMIPNEGDSSTLVKLEGMGFDYVSKIYFALPNSNTVSQAIILDTRTNSSLEILPPPITELGKTLVDIRKSIETKKEGFKVEIIFVRGKKQAGSNEYIDLAFDLDDENVIRVENLFFYYIDKLPYQNNCEKPELPPGPSETVEVEEDPLPDLPPIQYQEGTDLEFLNKILPEKEQKIQQIYDTLLGNLQKYNEINSNQLSQLQTAQALETLDEVNKQFNYERYVITQQLLKNMN